MQAQQLQINETLGRLQTHWQVIFDARGGVPARLDFDLPGLKPCLGNLIIYMVFPGDPFRVQARLLGTSVTQLDRAENTGAFLDDYAPPHLFEQVFTAYREVFKTRRPVRSDRAAHFRDQYGRRHGILGSKLVLPLANDGITVDQFLVALYSIYPEHLEFDRDLLFV